MKYLSTIECKIVIEFEDPKKAKSFFIDSDWSKYFTEATDLEELTEHLSLLFHNTQEKYETETNQNNKESYRLIKRIEGFGIYIYVPENKFWRLSDENAPKEEGLPCGGITIKYIQELSTVDTEELK